MEKFFIALTVLIAIIAVQYKFDIQTTINVSNSGKEKILNEHFSLSSIVHGLVLYLC